MKPKNVAVIDIGKTNAKLALVNLDNLSEVAVITRPNMVLSGPPWPHFDVESIWEFILKALSSFNKEHGVDAITVTTHGACCALIGADGKLAAPILDYEFTGLDTTASEYELIRPDFSETGSPRLPGGLNLGAQLHWQFAKDPGLKDRVSAIVTYPQYWAHRLTGVASTDVSSLGCHTDLWNPFASEFSSLIDQLDIGGKIAPARLPADVLGSILPEIADLTGLGTETSVYCGIHDSNASLLPHLLSRKPPFSVVSTGTWVVAMSIGGTSATLNPKQDTLINVNAFGEPVNSARFMGGREYDLATGGACADPTDEDAKRVLSEKIMLTPAVVDETGPFQGQRCSWVGREPMLGSGERVAAVSYYLALVTSECLRLIGHKGAVVVEGPFARNAAFLQMLKVVAESEVVSMVGETGTSQGAALLAKANAPIDANQGRKVAKSEYSSLMEEYSKKWRHLQLRT